jgi:DNA-binding NtrC family response regulator
MLEVISETALNDTAQGLPMPEAVLIIDDEAIAAEELAEALSELGHPCHVAMCHESATRALEEHPEISTIISDFYLHSGVGRLFNGISLIDQLKSEFPERDLDVIIVSGDHDLLAECTALGPLKFLSKPVAPESLSAMLSGGKPENSVSTDIDAKISDLHRLIECQSEAIRQLTESTRAYQSTARHVHDRLNRITSAALLLHNRLRNEDGNFIDLTKYIASQSSATQQIATRKPDKG